MTLDSPSFFPILYRPNVAAILRNSAGQIFIAERLHVKDSWQFPQGGVDEGEDLVKALFRELQEEIGVQPEQLEILRRREGYRYAFAKNRLKHGIYGGQEQTYFECRYLGCDGDIRLDATDQEFSRWRWIVPSEFRLEWVPKFKQAVYRQVFQDFFGLQL
jgi:putative (di)nucleoside polyphosphate hydrolase